MTRQAGCSPGGGESGGLPLRWPWSAGGPMLRCRPLVRRPLVPAVRLWRRNIQLRVVAGTLLMSLVVVLVLGFVVVGQVRNGLLDAKEQGGADPGRRRIRGGAGQGQRASGGRRGRAADSTGATPDNAVADRARRAARQWRPERLQRGRARRRRRPRTRRAPRRGLRAAWSGSVPAEPAQSVDKGTGAFKTYSQIRYTDGQEPEPGLVVGKRLDDIDQQAVPALLPLPADAGGEVAEPGQGTLATAGLFVVVLLGAIAWFVVRQVVTPVRMAAGIAERLSAGRLQERMKVTGEDDIARLGEAFNKMAQNLQLKIQQLEELSRMQRRFVSDVSHELRTPLTTVRMAADVIHDARVDFDPVTARSAELLAEQLDRFESLLADLLEISRFDAGAAALEAEPIDLREVVRRVISGAEPLAERKGTRIRVVGDEQPVIAEADARRVERVLRNLVVNAVEHGEGRDVVVRLARRAGRSRSPCVTTGSGSSPARRPGCSTASGGPTRPVRVRRAVPVWAVHRGRGRPAARRLAAGVGRAGRRFAVPADPAAYRGRAAARFADTAGAGGLTARSGSYEG